MKKQETIKTKVVKLLKSGWFSTNQMVQRIGAQSADRIFRYIREEGIYNIQERKRKDGITERTIKE